MTDSLILSAFENMFWIFRKTTGEFFTYGFSRWWYSLRWALFAAWFGSSPNLAVLRHLKKHSPHILEQYGGLPDDCGDLTYGETLPGTAFYLIKDAELPPGSTVVDLGCGRGVFPLTAAAAFGFSAVGCDIVDEYIQRGEKASRLMGLSGKAVFKGLDFAKDKLPKGDLYFLSATCLDDDSWKKLLKNLHKTAVSGCQAVSISRPLPGSLWQLQKRELLAFTWGKAVVYSYTRR